MKLRHIIYSILALIIIYLIICFITYKPENHASVRIYEVDIIDKNTRTNIETLGGWGKISLDIKGNISGDCIIEVLKNNNKYFDTLVKSGQTDIDIYTEWSYDSCIVIFNPVNNATGSAEIICTLTLY
jgi:uncharacterized membrane protein YvbJ